MQQIDEFLGLCPLCYKPTNTSDDVRTIKNGEINEIYHALCIYGWSIRNAVSGAGMTVLEKYKHLVVRDISKREEWIASNLLEWEVVGEVMRGMREELDISNRVMAKELGVSIARIKRFEKGEPVRDAKLIYHAYLLKITAEDTRRRFSNYYNHTQGIQQFYHTLETAEL
jgi:ribosome-binding protein aMBF1 (putative translation factor)